MGANTELERRLLRLEHRAEIRNLVGRYCFVIDDRDLEEIAELFTRDARFHSRDGVMDARGREAIMQQFHGRFSALGPGFHYNHDHVIWFDDHDDRQAYGLVSTHAELIRNDRPMWAALRYEDTYRLEDGRWRFADRLLLFFYYLDVEEYARHLGSSERNRAYDQPRPADVPESRPTWQAWHARNRPGG